MAKRKQSSGIYSNRARVKLTPAQALEPLKKMCDEWDSGPDLDKIEENLRAMLRPRLIEGDMRSAIETKQAVHFVDVGDGWRGYHFRATLSVDEQNAASDALSALHVICDLRTCQQQGKTDRAAKVAMALGSVLGRIGVRPFERYVRKSMEAVDRMSAARRAPAEVRRDALEEYYRLHAKSPARKLGSIQKRVAGKAGIHSATLRRWIREENAKNL